MPKSVASYQSLASRSSSVAPSSRSESADPTYSRHGYDDFDEQQAEAIRNAYRNALQSSQTSASNLSSPRTVRSRRGLQRRSEADLRLRVPRRDRTGTAGTQHGQAATEQTPLLSSPEVPRSGYRATSVPGTPRYPFTRSHSYVNSVRGPLGSRRGSFARGLMKALGTAGDEEEARAAGGEASTSNVTASKRSLYWDDRVWYDQFTSTDWVHDSIADAYRVKELRSRRDFRGRVKAFFDGAQGWLLVFVIGCVTAGFAYMIDVTEAKIFDWKTGYCSSRWYFSKRQCCSGASACEDWSRWSRLIDGGQDESGKLWLDFAAFVGWVVLLALAACVVTLRTKTTISSAISLSTLDENLGAERHDSGKGRTEGGGPGTLSPTRRFQEAAKRPPVVYYPAAGSGVAEVRVILSGFVLHGYLGAQTLVYKTVGLILSVGSGLSVGKEGPYVHIAACIGNIASRVSSKYRNNDAKRREVLSASAAAGVAVAFGAPIGGVLFSLEEVSYYFPPKTMFRTFFCCIAAALSLKFLNPYGTNKIVLFQVRYVTDWNLFEIIIFAALGVMGGTLGALFIKASRIWAKTFRRSAMIKSYPMLEVFIVAVVTGLVSFWNRYTRVPVAELLYELAAPCDAFSDTGTGLCPTQENIPETIRYLFAAFFIKAMLTVVTFGIKVPAGIYVPSMVVGGLLGRIVGHIVQLIILRYPDLALSIGCSSNGSPEACVVPGVYALVAAGATMCGVTRLSVTLAVILFELTGSLEHVLPFAMGVLIAKWTADALEPLSIYDLLTDMNAYPYLDHKVRPVFTTDLGDITTAPNQNRYIDITASAFVPAKQLRFQLEYLHMAGEIDGGLPILRHDVLVGLIPGPDLEFALDLLESEDEAMCLMDARAPREDKNKRPNSVVAQREEALLADATDGDGDDHTITEGESEEYLSRTDTTSSERTTTATNKTGPTSSSRIDSATHEVEPSSATSPDEEEEEDGGPDLTDFTRYIDPSPVSLDITSPMDLVFECFVKLGLRYICVTCEGKYAGMVHKKTFSLAKTASSQKKRKLAPFAQSSASPSTTPSPQSQTRERTSSPTQTLPAIPSQPAAPEILTTGSTPPQTSSSPAQRGTAIPSSPLLSSAVYQRPTPPPRFLPPHLHHEVLPSREEGTVGSLEGGVDNMAGSENGSERSLTGAGRVVGARSASPAKRSATAMEEGVVDSIMDESTPRPVEDEQEQETVTHVEDTAMSGMTPASVALETQEMDINSASTSTNGNDSTSTSASSLLEEVSEKAPAEDQPLPPSQKEPHSTERVDEQVAHVTRLGQAQLDEGVKGVVVSSKWLERVLSRSTEGLQNREYPKEARDGLVGPMDNSDIVPEGAFEKPYLMDVSKEAFIPLKPGLTLNSEIQILPFDAYGYIISEYGHVHSKPIIRYAHNTANSGSDQQNVVYELYPPVVTIRKVPRPDSQAEAVKPKSGTGSLPALKLKKEARDRKEADAVRLVSSKSEKVQNFLARCKEAAGISRETKVKVFRLIDPTIPAANRSDSAPSGVPSPPDSRSTSPASTTGNVPKLILDSETFGKMKGGTNLEPLELKDQTGNVNFNGGSMNVQMAGVHEDMTLVLEETLGGIRAGQFQSDAQNSLKIPKSAGSLPASTTASGRTSPAPERMMTRGRARKDGRPPGVVGLQNLGNTCYMNSALQCIRSVEELAIFFLTKKYKKEINNDNPLGHHGRMANAYHSVIEGIYGNNNNSSFRPSHFKTALGNAQPMFSGYGQQDSQEFLSFLVDALHEDLNRIKKKPYIENPDSNDATVHLPEAIIELGETYRNNHRLRNDSVAMDLFSGFYKNKMECPKCDKVSVTFDPYSLLTVQLPVNVSFNHTVVFVPLQGPPVRQRVDIDNNATVKALKESVASKHPGVEASRTTAVEIWHKKVYNVFDDRLSLQEAAIKSHDDIFIYELDGVPTNPATADKYSSYMSKREKVPAGGMDAPQADCFAVPIIHRLQGSRNPSDEIMYPLFITVTREEAKDYDVILKKTLQAVANMTTRPILKEFTEASVVKKDDSEAEMVDAEPAPNEDSAGVSDHSAQSEDGYVNVSHASAATDSQILTNGTSAMQIDEPGEDAGVPHGFMDPEYFLSPALRTHLFEMKYSSNNNDNLYPGNNTSYNSYVHPMVGRVKALSRRSSTQSSRSDETSSTTNGTTKSEESDADDDEERPDIVVGESSLSAEHVSDSSDELNGPNTIMEPSAREENVRGGRGKRNKNKKYGGKKGKRGGQQNRNSNRNPTFGFPAAKPRADDDSNPYYIQLGETIVLDWKAEAVNALFEGGDNDADGLRGRRTMDDEGRHGPIFDDPELEARVAKRARRHKHGVTLEECFAETGKREVLSEDNTWFCNRCKDHRRAAKTLEIWTLPDILVVHLKRFGGGRGSRDKLDINVEFPIEGLDMTDKVGLKEDGKEYIYDLFAIDLHFGGLGGGHYTAMAKNWETGDWYDYNDASCSKITDLERLQQSAAYLLFYRRRSNTPLGNADLQELVNKYKNPSSDDEELDAGEGQLGGPIRSSHGPSSGSQVGVGTADTPRSLLGTSLLDGTAVGGGGIGAVERNLNPRRITNFSADDALPSYSASGATWGFDGLRTDAVLGGGAEGDDDDDGASTTAQGFRDNDSGMGDDTPPLLTVSDGEWIDDDASDEVEEMSRDIFDPPSRRGSVLARELEADFREADEPEAVDITLPGQEDLYD
ncbi:unnamed protein product [Zymoseptoria tritici ST99CH_1E4]|uniref:Uncharacterized protein n=1 Tax=Zymoseptoria tritici ST99CH_1E4 TaxID=1276532 RepID=A0A2H1G5C3_ZYMTR|nr:unnamed protein product [Zymoseptoria tritici ST99CH_1E4]